MKQQAIPRRTAQVSRTGVAASLALVLFSGFGVAAGLWKLLGISWVAFAAMAGGAWLGGRHAAGRARGLVWAYGLASGAMITSAAAFLVPPAIGHAATAGGFGVAFGFIAGFAVHTAGHQLTHRRGLRLEPVVVELSVHALAAGTIIGIVYGAMPELGLLLGLAIVSHKGPAGYAAARRLRADGCGASVLLVPAAAVGLTALPAGLLSLPDVPAVNAVVFGFAAGVFLHVATDFLPRCEIGGDVHEATGHHAGGEGRVAHRQLDRLRLQAAASTALGGAVVLALWGLVA